MFINLTIAPEFLTRKHKVYEVNWLFDTVSSIGHEPELDAQQYIATIQSTLEKVVALKAGLENAIFEGKEFENFNEQEQKLKVCMICIRLFLAFVNISVIFFRLSCNYKSEPSLLLLLLFDVISYR